MALKIESEEWRYELLQKGPKYNECTLGVSRIFQRREETDP